MRSPLPGLLLCAALAATSAGAQGEEATPDPAPTPAPAPASPEAEPPPPAPAPRKAAAPKPKADESPPRPPGLMPDDPQLAQVIARRFFNDLLLGDARELVYGECAFPFFMEDKKFSTPEELLPEWLKILRDKRTDLLTLYGIEMLSPAEMEKKYGKPPARLANLPWHAPKTVLAVGNLSGHAGVVVIASGQKGWRVVGYHD
jgi:hypothetical protein